MDKNELISLLNKALQMEYVDIFLYPRQADIVKEKTISNKFNEFGRMELRHADNISMQILQLGSKPVWEFTLLDPRDSVDSMLKDHLKGEERSIDMYNKIINLIEGEELDQLKLVIKGIKAEEEGHLEFIKKLIREKQLNT